MVSCLLHDPELDETAALSHSTALHRSASCRRAILEWILDDLVVMSGITTWDAALGALQDDSNGAIKLAEAKCSSTWTQNEKIYSYVV
jgi:hypothetical protein